MKKLSLILIFLKLSILATCQEVKLIVFKFDNSDQKSETFTVLKSNKTIKHGEYKSYFKVNKDDLVGIKNGIYKEDDFIKEYGTYSEGKKNGFWIEKITLDKKNEGNYKSGKKVGIWDSYLEKQKVSSYDYDKKKKVGIWLTYTITQNWTVIEKYDYDKNKNLEPIIKFKLQDYPKAAKENGIQGTVIMKLNRKSNCEVDSIQVLQSLSPDCDKMAVSTMMKYYDLYRKYKKSGCRDTVIIEKFNFKLE